MKALNFFGLLIGLLAITGCKDEDPVAPTCKDYTVNLGSFYLESSSINSFPYSATDSNLVFKNQDNEELVLTRSFSFHDTLANTLQKGCPYDTTVEIPYLYSLEQIAVNFKNDSLGLKAYFSFQAAYRNNNAEVTGESDLANFHLQKLTLEHSTAVSSVLTHKSGEMLLIFNTFFPSITLGAKTFTNVFSNFPLPQNPSDFRVYMNFDIGIVGFEDIAEGKLWVFDRIE